MKQNNEAAAALKAAFDDRVRKEAAGETEDFPVLPPWADPGIPEDERPAPPDDETEAGRDIPGIRKKYMLYLNPNTHRQYKILAAVRGKAVSACIELYMQAEIDTAKRAGEIK